MFGFSFIFSFFLVFFFFFSLFFLISKQYSYEEYSYTLSPVFHVSKKVSVDYLPEAKGKDSCKQQ